MICAAKRTRIVCSVCFQSNRVFQCVSTHTICATINHRLGDAAAIAAYKVDNHCGEATVM